MRRIALATALVLVVAACGGGESAEETAAASSSPAATDVTTTSAGGSATPDTAAGKPTATSAATPVELPPGSITVSLEEGAAVTATIGSEGGTLSTTGADGTAYTLTVPPEALFSDVDITMTPITAAEGVPLGDAQAGGVRLEPAGLAFLDLVTVEMSGPAIPAEAVGFLADGDGDNFHPAPSTAGDGSVTVATSHFSDVGWAELQIIGLVSEYGIGSLEGQALLEIAMLSSDTALQALGQWVAVMRADLEAASTTPPLEEVTARMVGYLARLSDATGAFNWKPGDPDFDELQEATKELIEVWFRVIGADVERIAQSCTGGTPEKGFRILRWALIAVAISTNRDIDRTDLVTDWAKVAAECLRFRIDWDVSVVFVQGGLSATTESNASVILPSPETFSEVSGVLIGLVQGDISERAETDVVIDRETLDLPLPNCDIDVEDGRASVFLEIVVDLPYLSNVGDAEISEMTVAVGTDEPVWITCRQDPNQAEHGFTWYSAPLEIFNIPRNNSNGYAEFALEIVRDGAVFARTSTTDTETDPNGTTGTMNQAITVTHVGGG